MSNEVVPDPLNDRSLIRRMRAQFEAESKILPPANRVKALCPHGVDLSGDSFCVTCLKDVMGAE